MNAKIYNGNVQPNPKEYKVWVNDEGTIKTWNGTEWIENASGEGDVGGEAGKNISVCMISKDMIENLPESYINALKSISDVVSYDNSTLIPTDIAHSILDLNAIVFHYDEYVIKPDKNRQVDFNSPLQYIYNGEYINLQDVAGFKDSQNIGFNTYIIMYNGAEIFQIIHVTNENASKELGEEYSKLGFYIKNAHPA